MVDGALVLYVERGGKTLLASATTPKSWPLAGAALVGVVKRGAIDKLAMEKVNGHGILDTPVAAALAQPAPTPPRRDCGSVPEGDSVFRAAAQLHAALAGQQLISSDFRVPRFATLNLGGWTVEEVVPRGKHLLMRLQGPARRAARAVHRTA